ncbi:response regulator [Micromonospora sp. C32]|uniref:response regulator n=1 Tax=unclassified Micromonospora TaxID=2617518 RepID=UPI001B39AB9D|nr:response regulator transcription factor [Micromonospora sp. C32]MBQ1056482.1 response regulator transcription factor [Micromonospora sp. C32]
MRDGTVRLAVVDDHALFVRGLELLLSATTDGRTRVVGSTTDAAGAAALVTRSAPDLVLVDLHMPPPGGLRAIAAIRRTSPHVRVLAMSGSDDPAPAVEALRCGAEGYLPKTSEPEDLLPPLLAVLDGWAVVPGALLRRLVGPVRSPGLNLDDEERRLLRAIATGEGAVTIAERMHTSERTVKRMTAALLRKLRVTNRVEAAALAGRAGLLDERPER